MEAPVETASKRDWIDLPPGVLQHTFQKVSTWQTPGTCLAAPVCRSWQRAAAGCRGTRLLYHSGCTAAAPSFVAWLQQNSQQLEALILSSDDSDLLLTVLEEAAAAAQAAGSPLRLRTRRVVQGDVHVRTAGQLLARLPHLRCLQLSIQDEGHTDSESSGADSDAVLQHLAPMRTLQLEQLYLTGLVRWSQSLARLLPLSLRRLSLDFDHPAAAEQHDLSHLMQLTFLRLGYWLTSSKLPPGLQQLEVDGDNHDLLRVGEEQRQVVTAWTDLELMLQAVQQLLPFLPNLRAARVTAVELDDPAALAAFQQLQQLLALTANMWLPPTQASWPAGLMAATASMTGLRRLQLRYQRLVPPPPLDALTQLTQLRVSVHWPSGIDEEQQQQQQQRAWAEVVGRMASLQWLSVPDVLLAPGQAWLGGLQQLRVLALQWEVAHGNGMPSWLEGCSWEGLLPQLQVLGVSGVSAQQAASWQLRRRLRQALGSSGCEVVVGVDLDEVADPAQQLAGLPAALQQALA